jgi:hypothetical protein
LKGRRQKRRRQDNNRDLERVLAEPSPPVGHDGEHHDELSGERDPDRPVENRSERAPQVASV